MDPKMAQQLREFLKGSSRPKKLVADQVLGMRIPKNPPARTDLPRAWQSDGGVGPTAPGG
jgi:hypothetical protein